MEEIIKQFEEELEIKRNNVLEAKLKKFSGDTYEKYVLNHLIEQKKEAYLWLEIPLNILLEARLISDKDYNNQLKKEKRTYSDEGIDILIKEDNKFIYVQCKNHRKNICTSNLFSYHKLMDIVKDITDIKGIVYSGSKIGKKLLKRSNVEYIHLEYNNIEYENYKKEAIYNIWNNQNIIQEIKNKYNKILIKINIIDDPNLYGENKWEYYIQELESYIDTYKKLPNDNQNLMKFICYQQQYCNKDNYNKKNEWAIFINKYKEYINK